MMRRRPHRNRPRPLLVAVSASALAVACVPPDERGDEGRAPEALVQSIEAGLDDGASRVRIADGLVVPRRAGPRPRTTQAPPGTALAHEQLDQHAPRSLQDALFARAAALPDVTVGPSRVSVDGARAFLLDAAAWRVPARIGDEFGHLHPSYDGSLHLVLTPALVARIEEAGWGEAHPRAADTAMIYGPRDRAELEVVWQLVALAYRRARGELEP